MSQKFFDNGPEGAIIDPVLGHKLSFKTIRVLRLCPVDVFFTAKTKGLHASTVASLGRKGYLNFETTKDGLELEYYLNNHGHRIRRMHMEELSRHIIPDYNQ